MPPADNVTMSSSIDTMCACMPPTVTMSSPGASDLGITATLGALLAQAAPWRNDSAAPVGKLAIAGDAELARRVQRLAQRFDPDWDAALARAEQIEATTAAVLARAHADGVAPGRAAEAIARELSSNVYAVAAISVESVVWNAAPEVRAAQPALKQVSCTATVRVAYEVVPRN